MRTSDDVRAEIETVEAEVEALRVRERTLRTELRQLARSEFDAVWYGTDWSAAAHELKRRLRWLADHETRSHLGDAFDAGPALSIGYAGRGEDGAWIHVRPDAPWEAYDRFAEVDAYADRLHAEVVAGLATLLRLAGYPEEPETSWRCDGAAVSATIRITRNPDRETATFSTAT